jgi:nucleotide-binding universal stress UspA family protein
MFHSILAAVDGSPLAAAALMLAGGVAQRHGARLTVLTAVPGPRTAILPLGMAVDSAVDAAAEATRILDEATARVPAGMTVSTRTEWAPPAHAIAREVERSGHDLVVLGSRGRGALRSTLLGSVARSVVGSSAVPVLVVKGDPACVTGRPFSRILVAVDGTEESEFALMQAADIARAEGATLTVLTVISVRRTPGMPESALVRLQCDAVEFGRSVLDDALARVAGSATTSIRLVWGQVEPAILAEIETGSHDLLVIGSRGRGTVRATLLGSVGYAMLRRATIPVLIARPPAPRLEPDSLPGAAVSSATTERVDG